MSSALKFDTPDCHVSGSCDLYTTKAAGSDKKLYKNIDQSLESQHAARVKFAGSASLSPPQRDSISASLNLSRSSPFGSLNEVANRRLFAYLIATLNASHDDYDFSQFLRPQDFKRERNLKRVMNHIDSTLASVRPNGTFLDASDPNTAGCGFDAPSICPGKMDSSDTFSSLASTNSPAWGPQMWSMIDKEMKLKDCQVFSYQPAENFEDEEGAPIWAMRYFFFNKALKRVCYLHVRGIPVMSSCSPRMRSAGLLSGGIASRVRGDGMMASKSSRQFYDDDDGMDTASKRARYWLGDRFVDSERVGTADDDDMMDEDDGLWWNRDADGDIRYGYAEDDEDEEEDFEVDDDTASEDEAEERRIALTERRASSGGGVSEFTASRMEIDT